MDMEGISFAYPDSEKLFESLNLTVGPSDKIGIIGKNGAGKSTLMRIMVGELSPTLGVVSNSPKIQHAYFGQTNIETLNPELTIEEELLALENVVNRTIARTAAGVMMFQGG